MDRKKILVIDDEKNLCFLLKSNLENIGDYMVDVAYSGEEGLRKAKEVEFDLVITDFRMPGLNGRDVLNALKEMRPKSTNSNFFYFRKSNCSLYRIYKSNQQNKQSIPKPNPHYLLPLCYLTTTS